MNIKIFTRKKSLTKQKHKVLFIFLLHHFLQFLGHLVLDQTPDFKLTNLIFLTLLLRQSVCFCSLCLSRIWNNWVLLKTILLLFDNLFSLLDISGSYSVIYFPILCFCIYSYLHSISLSLSFFSLYLTPTHTLSLSLFLEKLSRL